MKAKNTSTLLGFIIWILAISLLTSGGCEFSTNSDGDAGSASVEGNITSIDSGTDLGGVIVQVEDEDSGVFFSGTTDDNGDFQIEGDFNGSPSMLEFREEDETLIARTSITVFPGAEVDLGDITIDDGIVDFEDGIFVVLEGDVSEIDCFDDDEGTMVVTAQGDDDIEIIIQITSSTEIINEEDDEISCEDLLIGDQVEVRGDLIGSEVEADLLELL